jgi:hypothetical protein
MLVKLGLKAKANIPPKKNGTMKGLRTYKKLATIINAVKSLKKFLKNNS